MSELRLFVYGSLRSDLGILRPGPSAEASAFLAANAVLEGRATAAGRLYAPAWYPAFVPAPTGQVRGEVWRLGSETLFDPLDAFEGEAYVRETVRAQFFDGRRITAYAYRYVASLSGVPEIASGDYLDWVRNQS